MKAKMIAGSTIHSSFAFTKQAGAENQKTN